MNAALILSGGAGVRFKSGVPKQYHVIGGKMLIEYVILASIAARNIDTVLVAGGDSAALLKVARKYSIKICPGGDTRNRTIKSGLDALNKLGCDNVVILDAVRPLVTGSLIDEYIGFLNEGYDAVCTCQHITDSLGCYDMHVVDRERYYLMQSPEAYKFKLLSERFQADSSLTEVAHQLPEAAKIKLHFEFTQNPKLTYPWEKAFIARALKSAGGDIRK